MIFAAIVVGGYLLGSCPWGYWIVRIFRGEDVRKFGSGAIGTSNVWRGYGKRLGLTVMALDWIKGYVAARLGAHFVSDLCGIAAGAAAMIGHARPIFLQFAKGGKMVATGAGVCLALAPVATLSDFALWIAIALLTRYTSVASLVGALVMPFAVWFFGGSIAVIAFTAVAAAGVVFLHRGNIRRLINGTEQRFPAVWDRALRREHA